MLDYNVIVKLTPRCNLQCVYCNVEESQGKNFPLTQIDSLISWLNHVCSNKICSILWHGGEPLLLGVQYFETIFAEQKNYPGRFRNAVSTNGLLLNDEFIDLFQARQAVIKTSLDNLDVEQDFPRNHSCERVISKLDLLKKRKFDNVYVRMTVSKRNENDMLSMYDFMCNNYNYNWEFAPVIPAGLNRDTALTMLPDPEIFSQSAIKIFYHWFETHTISIPFFTEMVKHYLGLSELSLVSEPRINVGPDQMVYMCPLLIGNDKYQVGLFNQVETISGFNNINCIWDRLHKKECERCPHKYICRISVCAYLAVSLKGAEELADYYCSLWKPVYDEILATVDQTMTEVYI